MGLTFFFDTYAFLEIINQNPNYLPYIKKVSIITTKLNLMELHYVLLRTIGKLEADRHYDRFLPFVVEITDDVLKRANEFKLINRRKRLSYVDCIGYIIAKLNNIKFLTGDKEFKYFENVEFVK